MSTSLKGSTYSSLSRMAFNAWNVRLVMEKVLERCIATRLCLSNVKCHMMMTKGVVLGHYIYVARIQVDLEKIEVILTLPTSHR